MVKCLSILKPKIHHKKNQERQNTTQKNEPVHDPVTVTVFPRTSVLALIYNAVIRDKGEPSNTQATPVCTRRHTEGVEL
jgi:hypothetical protein